MAGAATAGSVRDALGGAVDALGRLGLKIRGWTRNCCWGRRWDAGGRRWQPIPERRSRRRRGRTFGEMVRRRLRREPVAYILGRKGFRHIELAVDRRVLIPRPETELLVELALELRPAHGAGRGNRVGGDRAGGRRRAAGVRGDRDGHLGGCAEGGDVANAERLGLSERVRFVKGSFPRDEEFDLILANLPYIAESGLALAATGGDAMGAARGVARRPRRPRRDPGGDSPGPVGRAWHWRWGRDRRMRWLRCWVGQGLTRSRSALTSPVSSGSSGGAGDFARQWRLLSAMRNKGATREGVMLVSIERDGAEAARSALERCIAAGGVAVFPADGLYGLACDPLNAAAIERIHRIKGRDDGKPSAVMYFSPLAMRELVETFGPKTREAVGRSSARPGHAHRRQPGSSLPARLSRGPRALGRPPHRRPARRRHVPGLPDLGQPQR